MRSETTDHWQSWVVAGALAVLCAIMFVGVPAIVSRTPEPALLPEPEAIRRGPDQRGDGVVEAGTSPQDD